jgi:uncharacterized protein YecT (DUF1311 family)
MKVARLLALLVLAAVPISSASAAPSFNCKKAKALVEKQICGNPEFEPLDRDIASLYARSLTVLTKSDGDALREDQRAWVKERDECEDFIHGDPVIMADVLACMRKTMSARKARLQAIFERKQFPYVLTPGAGRRARSAVAAPWRDARSWLPRPTSDCAHRSLRRSCDARPHNVPDC